MILHSSILPIDILMIAASIVAALLAIQALRMRRKVFWARSFALMAAGSILWMTSNATGSLADEIGQWDLSSKVTYMGIHITTLGLLFFSIQQSFRYRRIPRWIIVLFVVPIVCLEAANWTNDTFHLLWHSSWVSGAPISQPGLLFPFHLVYSYVLIALSLVFLSRSFLAREGIFRIQAGLLLAGVMVPVIITFFVDVFGWDPYPLFDEGAIGLIFTIAMFSLVTLRFKVYELMPVANDLIIRNMQEGMIVLDLEDHVVFINTMAAQILGQDPKTALGKPADRMLHAWSNEAYQGWLSGKVEVGVAYEGVMRHFRLTTSPLLDNAKEWIGRMLVIYDITESKRLEDRLQQMAITDPLTGCFNRGYFMEQAEQIYHLAERYHHPLSAVMIDLDHFKQVNDRYGHAMGDRVLQRVTELCHKAIRRSDLFARYGGEEFVLLIPETGQVEAAEAAERIRAAIATVPIIAELPDLKITASIGVAGLENVDGVSFEKLIDFADQAMYQAKAEGRNRVKVWK